MMDITELVILILISLLVVMLLACVARCTMSCVSFVAHKCGWLRFNADFPRNFEFQTRDISAYGDGVMHDYRKESVSYRAGDVIRIASYNIENAKKLGGIISDLKNIDADIVLLQEVDVFTHKCGFLNSGREIALALGLNYINICTKFVGKGYQGNAVLTKFDFATTNRICFDCSMKKVFKEHEFHSSPCPVVKLNRNIKIQVFSLHLDAILSGRRRRAWQLTKALEEVDREWRLHEEEEADTGRSSHFFQIVGGDFNTISTGMGRFVPLISPDFASICSELCSKSEAEYMQDVVIRKSRFHDPFQKGAFCSLKRAWRVDSTMNVYGGFAAKVDWLLFPSPKFLNMRKGEYKLEIQDKGIREGSSDHNLIFVDFVVSKKNALHEE